MQVFNCSLKKYLNVLLLKLGIYLSSQTNGLKCIEKNIFKIIFTTKMLSIYIYDIMIIPTWSKVKEYHIFGITYMILLLFIFILKVQKHEVICLLLINIFWKFSETREIGIFEAQPSMNLLEK